MRLKLRISLLFALVAFGMASVGYAEPMWQSPEWYSELKQRTPWLAAAVKDPFPKSSIHGSYRGAKFAPEEVLFYRRILQISKGEPTVGQAFIIQLPEHNVEGKTYYLLPGKIDKRVDARMIYFDTTGHCTSWGQAGGCGMKLQFGKVKNGVIPGYMLLRVGDHYGTNLGGYFYAHVKSDGFYHEFEL